MLTCLGYVYGAFLFMFNHVCMPSSNLRILNHIRILTLLSINNIYDIHWQIQIPMGRGGEIWISVDIN